MKKTQLEYLIHGIVRQILKEYDSSMSSSDLKKIADADPSLDASTPPDDTMTSAEKARIDRESEKTRRDNLKQKTVELDAEKKQLDFYKKKIDQSRRFNIPNVTKDIQRLKGAQI